MKSYALASLLVAGASAHLNGLCACTDPNAAGKVDFIFATYHSPPSAGRSVPGTAYIKNEKTGVTSSFAFNNFKAGENSGGTQEVTNRNQLIKGSGIVTQSSVCNCYGAKPSGAIFTPPMAPGVTSNTCGNDAWRTLYKATVSGASTADYTMWTTGTDVNLAPYSGMCGFTQSAPLKIGLTVADGKKSCTTAAPLGTLAMDGSGCAAGSLSGSQCVQTCPAHHAVTAGTGAPKCEDGSWIFESGITKATECYDTRFTPCSHTTCKVVDGHTVVSDWHASEQNSMHHHCSSTLHADSKSGTCRCECLSSFTESWIHHDITGDKKSISIASHIGSTKNDNENYPINRGSNAGAAASGTGHEYTTTTTTTTTTTPAFRWNDQEVDCMFSCTHRSQYGWHHPGNYATIDQCQDVCRGRGDKYFTAECPGGHGNVHCWCVSENAYAQSKAAGDQISWGNCDATQMTTGEADGMTTSENGGCDASLNNNQYTMSEGGKTWALGGACRSAVYKVV